MGSALDAAREYLATITEYDPAGSPFAGTAMLAALVAEIDAAPVVAITACNQIEGASDFDFGDMSGAVQKFRPGHRVALLRVGEGS